MTVGFLFVAFVLVTRAALIKEVKNLPEYLLDIQQCKNSTHPGCRYPSKAYNYRIIYESLYEDLKNVPSEKNMYFSLGKEEMKSFLQDFSTGIIPLRRVLARKNLDRWWLSFF